MLLYYHKFKDHLIIIKLCATELKIPFTFFYSHLEPKTAANYFLNFLREINNLSHVHTTHHMMCVYIQEKMRQN